MSQSICANAMLIVRSYWLEQHSGTERQMSSRQDVSTTRAAVKNTGYVGRVYRTSVKGLKERSFGAEQERLQS